MLIPESDMPCWRDRYEASDPEVRMELRLTEPLDGLEHRIGNRLLTLHGAGVDYPVTLDRIVAEGDGVALVKVRIAGSGVELAREVLGAYIP